MATKLAKIGTGTLPAATTPRAHPNGVPCLVAYNFLGSFIRTVGSTVADLAPAQWTNFYASADATSVYDTSGVGDGIVLLSGGTFLACFTLRIASIHTDPFLVIPSNPEFSIGGEVRHTFFWPISSNLAGDQFVLTDLDVTFACIASLPAGPLAVDANLHIDTGTCIPYYMSLQLARVA